MTVFILKLRQAKRTSMEVVQPPGSPLSSLDSGRPGESLGVGVSVEHCFFMT